MNKPSNDEENAPPPYTEQTPLLQNEERPSSAQDLDEHEQAALLDPSPDHHEPAEPAAKRTKSWWAWRIFWTIAAALVLAVFIKGWIDAGDTDVT